MRHNFQVQELVSYKWLPGQGTSRAWHWQLSEWSLWCICVGTTSANNLLHTLGAY